MTSLKSGISQEISRSSFLSHTKAPWSNPNPGWSLMIFMASSRLLRRTKQCLLRIWFLFPQPKRLLGNRYQFILFLKPWKKRDCPHCLRQPVEKGKLKEKSLEIQNFQAALGVDSSYFSLIIFQHIEDFLLSLDIK